MSSIEAQFASHLRGYRAQTDNLKKALAKKGLVRNPERLDALFRNPPALKAVECPLKSGENTFEWAYEIVDLRLALSGIRHPQPPGAKIKASSGLLSCKVTEYFCPLRGGGVAGLMPVKSVDMNFIVEGEYNDDDGDHPLIACWHVDTHKDETEEADESGKNAEDPKPGGGADLEREDNHSLHPLFHFQFGGRKLRPNAPLVRGVLMLDVPRIAIPPLDLNLAVDFVVTNFSGSHWQALRRDTQYAHPVRSSMRKIWAPYFATIAGHFSNDRAARDQAQRYLPDLL